MEEYLMSYREVIPDQTNPEKWKEITLNIGGTHSTLQDIKVAEKAGGYSYKDLSQSQNRNRFIYWRTSHDIIELAEISLDYNLINNNVRYKFADSPVLSVGIFEIQDFIVILIATVGSIHRLNFPHPDTFHKRHADVKPFSIFHEANVQMASIPSSFYVLGQSNHTNMQIPHAASCWLSSGDALFAIAYQSSLFLYILNTSGQTTTQELKQHNFVPRIFSNITGALRGKRNLNDGQFATSLVFGLLDGQCYLYALYRDDHIRMWSKNGSCIATINCLDGTEPRPQGPQTNLLRKASETTLCAFFSHSCGSEFVTIEISGDGKVSNFVMNRMYMVAAPDYDLVDFEVVDSKIWGLWCNSNGEFNVSSHFLTPGYDCVNWITAPLEPPPDRFSINLDRGVDPKDGYCSYIFHPGKFQKSVISKALTMFKRSNIFSEADLPMSILKDRVCQAIENEMQNEIKEYEVSDVEYLEISSRLWERFYSCCEQYHTKSWQPIGIVQINSIGSLCIIKKNMFSLLRPCGILEHLMLAGDNAKIDDLTGNELIDNQNLCSDLIQLVSILSYIEGQLADEIKIDIDKKLYQLHLPNEIISKMITDIDEYDEFLPKTVINEIHNRVQLIIDLPSTMIALLDMFNMDQEDCKSVQDHLKLGEYTKQYLSFGQLFGNNYGISVLAESVRQSSLIRYSLSRNTLILQMLLIELYSISSSQMEIIRSKCMSQTIVFVQAYYVMVWICETTVNPTTTAGALESSMQRLSVLKLSDSRHYTSRVSNSMSLLELFLRGKGLTVALSIFAQNSQSETFESHWQYTLLSMVSIIGKLIWAVSGKFTFGEWLMGSCQHVLIQEYVRLLNSWCEWNNCSRHFILAVSLLDNGEHKKAFNLFMQADRGVTTEQFLIDKILQNDNNWTANDAVAEYYLKIIQLFEQYSAFDCVILMAKAAINILDKKDLKLAMFQSIIFSKHLALEHYEEAYESLIHNAEPLRRKDCLCQLVVCLFQEKRLDLLMHFPYIGLQEEVENIIESRARAMPVDINNHYDFLYSFYITKGNMRKAASVMYERAMRYLLECDSVSSMESRYHCLLACINALHLVDEKYAWIVKPAINDEHNMDTEDLNNTEKVTVLEIKHLKKELQLTEAILLVSKHNNKVSVILNAGAAELVAILSSLNLYTAAVRLSKHFDLNISSVLESVTLACINTIAQQSDEIWKWLSENDIIDLSIRDSAIDTAWNLLKNLLENNEKENLTILHKTIARKILSCGIFLPQWLYSSYKKLNTPELLKLFVSNGRLIEATELAIEYINAMLKGGIEYFNLKNTLHSTLPPLCFPTNTIDLLLHGLDLNAESDYKECYEALLGLVKVYISTVSRISKDKIQYEYRFS